MNLSDEAIRKAAILVSALDTAAADALLESMDDALAARVRATYMELDDVDVAEQRRVIEQFMGGKAPAPSPMMTPAPAAAIDELELSSAVPLAEYLNQAKIPALVAETATTKPDTAASTFDFLDSATGDELALALRDEHAQTIAVVLAHVAPATAAAALARLSPVQQGEVARRIVDLQSVDGEALGELRAGLQKSLCNRLSSLGQQCSGLDAMKRIWQEASAGERATLQLHLRDRDARLLVNVDERAPPTTPPSPEPAIRLETAVPATQRKSRTLRPTMAFEALAELDAAALGYVLQRSESRTLLLALAGASSTFIAGVYAQLPRREAQLLQRQIEQQGPISLRDVAEAQRRIAALAVKLACDGEIEIPGLRHWEMAA